MIKILVIDDDTYICTLLENFLSQQGYKVQTSYDASQGLKKFKEFNPQLVLCDYRLPNSDGLEVLASIKKLNAAVPIIIMTAYGDVRMAVKLIKSGAFDYITKPIQPDETLQLIKKALSTKKSTPTAKFLDKDFILGSSHKINKVMEHIKAVAPTELTVLIQGETGSGKEFIARNIHYSSQRKDKPFVAVDCGSLPRELANSELFGHVKGSFTGAVSDKKGYFEYAKGGTLFLDEVGNLPYENQVKLLRAIQERVINRVGDTKNIAIDVRIIAATNEDLLEAVDDNTFREDLYHRLNGFKINLPPLRERGDDIFLFAENFIERANKTFNKKIEGISDEVKKMFKRYKWHGNFRELENVINRSVLLEQTEFITPSTLPDEIRFYQTKEIPDKDNSGLKEATYEAEKEAILNALKETNFNKSQAARKLNIDRKTLYNKLSQYNIELSTN